MTALEASRALLPNVGRAHGVVGDLRAGIINDHAVAHGNCIVTFW